MHAIENLWTKENIFMAKILFEVSRKQNTARKSKVAKLEPTQLHHLGQC